MNRDREAIARAIYGCDWTCGSLWENRSQTLRNEYLAKADAILALSVEGGVTELLREAEQMLTAVRDGDASQSAVDRTVSRLRAALTPRVEE